MSSPTPAGTLSPPLYVDLDGTLIRSDLLLEGLCRLAREAPWSLWAVPFWLIRGKAYFKGRVAERVTVDPTLLPFHADFLAYLRAEKAKGRRLVLASASHRSAVQPVADHLRLFDGVMATEGDRNLRGAQKRDAILTAESERGFDYAGNAMPDLPIWKVARRAILANAAPRTVAAARRVAEIDCVFDDRPPRLATVARALRLHQWAKNLLLFVPLIAGHRVRHLPSLGQAAVAFLAFGLCASAVYLVNDLMDLASDRRHPRKRERPFASGALDLGAGFVLIPGLLLASGLLAATLPVGFGALLGLYVVITFAYSFGLKRIVMMDVLVLAGLYTLRVLAGAAATAVRPSFWLLAFSMFVFLSLALTKRVSELADPRPVATAASSGRGYLSSDLDLLRSLGASAGYLSVLVLALYLNSRDVAVLYSSPAALWLLCPVLLYWISRMWLVTMRGQLQEDPVVFALKDRVSWGVCALAALIVAVATR